MGVSGGGGAGGAAVGGTAGEEAATSGRWVLVTGSLARESLEHVLERGGVPAAHRMAVLPIKVAALITNAFLARALRCEAGECVLLPGLCKVDVEQASRQLGVPVALGPKDVRDLPAHFGRPAPGEGYGEHDLHILAEINDAGDLPLPAILAAAERYARAGADVIDVGCTPGRTFEGVGGVVRALKERGYRVSIDSFNPEEILRADEAGAELVLSLNSENIALAGRLSAVPVIIPDPGAGVDSLATNAERARAAGAPRLILDPVLEPIHFGLAASIRRYVETRERFPDADILMGVGNLTELTEADSTGVNAVFLGLMSELEVRYVLTTEVAAWARGSVRELDAGRRLMHYARRRRALPKGIDRSLLTCRDPRPAYASEAELRSMQGRITDLNFRIDTDGGAIYVLNRDRFVKGTNIRDIFTRLGLEEDGSHAFYMGRELMKAQIALRLGKKYHQGEPLEWGYLTWPEDEDPPGHEEARRRSQRRAHEKARAERARAARAAPAGGLKRAGKAAPAAERGERGARSAPRGRTPNKQGTPRRQSKRRRAR